MLQSFSEYDSMSKDDLEMHLNHIANDLEDNKLTIMNEIDKKEKYMVYI